MKKRFYLLVACLLMVCLPNNLVASTTELSEWKAESNSKRTKITTQNGVMDIVSPEGLTLWYDEKLTGDYEISYSIQVVTEGGKYDRLSDMNCFWGAKDPKSNDMYTRASWRNGEFKSTTV